MVERYVRDSPNHSCVVAGWITISRMQRWGGEWQMLPLDPSAAYLKTIVNVALRERRDVIRENGAAEVTQVRTSEPAG